MCSLPEDAYEYLMGRGATPEVIETWGLKVWEPPPASCPQENLHKPYGAHFERFENKIIYPLYSPKGVFLGFDSRSMDAKDDVRFLLPESRWNPVWIGMPGAMERIYAGADVVLVEGRFDVFAMLQIVKDRAVLGSGPAHLSWNQAEFLARWCTRSDAFRPPHVYIAFDNDATGHSGSDATLKVLDRRKVDASRLRYGRDQDDPGLIWDQGGVEHLHATFPDL